MRLACLPALLAVLLLQGCGKPDEKEAEPGPVAVKVATATLKDMRQLQPVDGTFTLPEGATAKLAPSVAGRVTKVFVSEGDHVKAGQLLATVGTTVLDAQSRSAAAGAAAAAAQADQSDLAFKAAEADQAASVRSATLALEAAIAERESSVREAQAEYDRLKAGPLPQEVSVAEQGLRQAEVSLEKAKADYERNQKLFNEGYAAGQDVDASKSAYDLASSVRKQAAAQLSLVKAGTRKEDLSASAARLKGAKEVGQKRVEQARAALDQARAAQLGVQAKSKDASAAHANAAQKAADAQAASQSANLAEIRAPFEGVVVRRALQVGDSADPTTPVLEIAKKGAKADFIGSVTSSEGSNLLHGMAVDFGTDAYRGFVKSVGVPDPQTGQVPVRIAVDASPGLPETGKFATARVAVRTLQQAVALPVDCIVSDAISNYVFMVKDGSAHKAKVEIGPKDHGMVAILKGVKAGDVAVLLGQQELSDGTKVEAEKPGADEK